MGLYCIIAGFILLANPVVNIVDIVPDAIGFFLIVGGLTKLSFVIEKIADARKLFWKLALFETAKLACSALFPFMDGSTKVLLTFCAGLIELLLFIPAINNLFEGYSYAGIKYNGTAMYEKHSRAPKSTRQKKPLKATESHDALSLTKATILFFYSFRVVSTLVPELTELQIYDRLGTVSAFSRSLTYYKPFLYVVFGLAVIIAAIVYIKRVVRFFNLLKNDKVFVENFTNEYKHNITTRETFFIARHMKQSLMCFSAAVVTSFVLTTDNINLMIGVISAGFLIAAAIIAGQYEKKIYLTIPFAIIRAVMAIVNLFGQVYYFAEYNAEDSLHFDNAAAMYKRLSICETIEYVFACASILIFMFYLLRTIKSHLAINGAWHSDSGHVDGMYNKTVHDLEIYNMIGGRLLLCAVLAIINNVLASVYYYILPSLEYIFLINSVVTIVYAAYVIATVNAINSSVYDPETEIFG